MSNAPHLSIAIKLCGGGADAGGDGIDDFYEMPEAVKNSLLGTMTKWIVDQAAQPQPTFALANALAFCGALLGNRVMDYRGTRSNIYTLGLGKSATGKDHSRKCIRTLSEQANAGHLMAGDDVTSDAAILRVTKAAEGSGVLLQCDEFGDRIASIKSKNAANTESAIITTFMKLFTSSDSVFGGKDYADDEQRPTMKINQPCACLYGTGTPATLWPNLTTTDIRGGFMGRILVFPGLDKRLGNWKPKFFHKELVAGVQAWSEYAFQTAAEAVKGQGNLVEARATQPTLMKATHTAAARAVLDEAEVDYFRSYEEEEAKGDGFEALYGRGLELVNKVALIAAAPLNPPPPGTSYIIDRDVAQWAHRLVENLLDMTATQCQRHVADSYAARAIKEVLASIRESGSKGVTKSELLRLHRKIKSREMDDILRRLAGEDGDNRVVGQAILGGSGPAATTFWTAGNLEHLEAG